MGARGRGRGGGGGGGDGGGGGRGRRNNGPAAGGGRVAKAKAGRGGKGKGGGGERGGKGKGTTRARSHTSSTVRPLVRARGPSPAQSVPWRSKRWDGAFPREVEGSGGCTVRPFMTRRTFYNPPHPRLTLLHPSDRTQPPRSGGRGMEPTHTRLRWCSVEWWVQAL